MERIKEESIIDAKTRCAELEVTLKSKNNQVETLESKVTTLLKEIERQKDIFNGGAGGDADLVITLKNTNEKLTTLQTEHDLMKRNNQREIGELSQELKAMTTKKEAFEEELTMIQNQDRAIREKCTQLEVNTKKLESQVVQQDYDLIKFQRLEKELIEDRDKLLGQIHEAQSKADMYFDELKKSRDVNDRLDYNNREMQKKLEASNPVIIQEQKELIIDLKSKVNSLEVELSLVNKNTAAQISDLRTDKEKLQSMKAGLETENAGNEEIWQMNIGKVRTLLIQSKKELEQASTQIGQLKQELASQQAYYEGHLHEQKEKPKDAADPNKEEFSLSDKYTLL